MQKRTKAWEMNRFYSKKLTEKKLEKFGNAKQ